MASNGAPSSDHRRLAGKVAIITGGASGIGEAAVKLFVEHGASVVIADIQDEKGRNLEALLGPTTLYMHCDVRSEESVKATVALAVEKFGKLDIMFNNAGILGETSGKDVTELDMVNFDEVIAVNLRGMAAGVKHAGKAMVEAGNRGVILCTSSVASVMAGMSPLAYTVSKHASLGLVRAAASDLGKHGIRVNCLSPFGVVTPMLMNYFRQATGDPNFSAAAGEAFRDAKANLKGHSLSALDVAQAALFLASDDAACVSGLNFLIDGGFTATSHAYE